MRFFSAVLVSLLVGGTAVSADAFPALASEEQSEVHADFDAWQVTLQDGRLIPQDQIGDLQLYKESVAEGVARDAFILKSEHNNPYVYGTVAYQIVMLGAPTGYWITARINGEYGFENEFAAKCEVYSGDPSAGGTLADSSPFTCSDSVVSPDERITFYVGLNRDAEASGAISPTGAVSLNNGTYKTYGLPYTKHGEESVPSGGTTNFDTVLRKGDTTPFTNQARNEFAYQIYDGGVPTKYWVAGLSTNYRGPVFRGDGRCRIYPSNPLAGEGQLDQRVPLNGTKYTCTATGSYKGGEHETGDEHFFSNFVVGISKEDEHPVVHADVDAWQVTLQDGHRISDESSGHLAILKGAAGTDVTTDLFTLAEQPRRLKLNGAAEYQIVTLGKPTGFWIRARVFFDSGNYRSECTMYSGAPSERGKLIDPDSSPFTCSTAISYDKPTDFRSTFHVGLNRDAEASGTISPTGALSLENRTFKSYGLPYAKLGDESVPAGGTTTFDTVLRVGDKPGFEKQARTEFAYRIYENGKPTDYWVAGMSTNYRGWAAFNGDRRCGIFQSNPLAGEGQFDQRVPLRASPYTCTADGSYQHGPHDDGNGHYDATFTVGRR
jgi:hypothetical protein